MVQRWATERVNITKTLQKFCLLAHHSLLWNTDFIWTISTLLLCSLLLNDSNHHSSVRGPVRSLCFFVCIFGLQTLCSKYNIPNISKKMQIILQYLLILLVTCNILSQQQYKLSGILVVWIFSCAWLGVWLQNSFVSLCSHKIIFIAEWNKW